MPCFEDEWYLCNARFETAWGGGLERMRRVGASAVLSVGLFLAALVLSVAQYKPPDSVDPCTDPNVVNKVGVGLGGGVKG